MKIKINGQIIECDSYEILEGETNIDPLVQINSFNDKETQGSVNSLYRARMPVWKIEIPKLEGSCSYYPMILHSDYITVHNSFIYKLDIRPKCKMDYDFSFTMAGITIQDKYVKEHHTLCIDFILDCHTKTYGIERIYEHNMKEVRNES